MGNDRDKRGTKRTKGTKLDGDRRRRLSAALQAGTPLARISQLSKISSKQLGRIATGKSETMQTKTRARLDSALDSLEPEVRVVEITDLVANGRTIPAIVSELAKLDRKLLRGVEKNQLGSVRAWTKKWQAWPAYGRLLVDRRNEVVGYWSAIPVGDRTEDSTRPSLYDRILQGKFLEKDLDIQDLEGTSAGGVCALYVSMFGLLDSHKKHQAILMNSFAAALLEFTRNKVFFSELIACAHTASGVEWCRAFKLKKRGPHKGGGALYARPLKEVIGQVPLLMEFEGGLLKAYGTKFPNLFG